MPAVNCSFPNRASCPIQGPEYVDSRPRPLWGVHCPDHGPEHVAVDSVASGTVAFRCTVEAGDGTTCGPITLPPPPRLPWSTRLRGRLPRRATVECIMSTLVIGFWIGVLVWARFFL